MPSLAEIILLVIPIVLFVIFLVLDFFYSSKFSVIEDVRAVRDRPIELNGLVWGTTNMKTEILYLAGRGDIELQNDDGQYKINSVRSVTDNLIDDKLTQGLILGGVNGFMLNETPLQRVLWQNKKSVEEAADDILVHSGLLTYKCVRIIWLIVCFIFPLLFGLVELGFTGQILLHLSSSQRRWSCSKESVALYSVVGQTIFLILIIGGGWFLYCLVVSFSLLSSYIGIQHRPLMD